MWNRQPDLLTDLQYSVNEKTLWSGTPKRGILFSKSDLFVIPFSLLYVLWIYFFFFSENSFFSNAGLFRWIFLAAFAMQCLYIFAGRFLFNALRRSKTEYAITNERVVISSGIFSKTIESLNLKTIYDISLKEYADRSGTISFGSEAKQSFWDNNKAPEPLKFEHISDAKRVYDIIMNAQSELKRLN